MAIKLTNTQEKLTTQDAEINLGIDNENQEISPEQLQQSLFKDLEHAKINVVPEWTAKEVMEEFVKPENLIISHQESQIQLTDIPISDAVSQLSSKDELKPLVCLSADTVITDWELFSNSVQKVYIEISIGNNSINRNVHYRELMAKCKEHNLPFGVIFKTGAKNEVDAIAEMKSLSTVIKKQIPDDCVISVPVRTTLNMYKCLLKLINEARTYGFKKIGISINDGIYNAVNAPFEEVDYIIVSGRSTKPIKRMSYWECSIEENIPGLEKTVHLIRK